VHDKTIRRRRAVLALLVVISLALLTDYFGESSNSPLHSIQRGIATALTPLQDGASTVLSPVRDVAGYISSTVNAKSQLSRSKSQTETLRRQLAYAQYEVTQYKKASSILKLDKDYGLDSYRPEIASVTDEDPVLWYRTITVDRGSNAGVKQYDPVIAQGGLIGDVTQVMSNESVVSLISSPKFSVGATVENDLGAAGLIQPQVGDPSVLTLINLPGNANISSSQLVVTSGFKDPSDPTIESFAPPGIPIGTVSGANPQNSVLTSGQVQVTPLAELQDLSVVQVLTRPHDATSSS
jgi:rod shape-determining protein MreC